MSTKKKPEKNTADHEPAATVISMFGGYKRLAELLGLSRTWVWRWKASKEKGGTSGLIPQEHHGSILAAARGEGIELSIADLSKYK